MWVFSGVCCDQPATQSLPNVLSAMELLLSVWPVDFPDTILLLEIRPSHQSTTSLSPSPPCVVHSPALRCPRPESCPAPSSAPREMEEPGSREVGTFEATDGSHITWASDHEPLSCVGAEKRLCIPILHLCARPCHRASAGHVRQECSPPLLHLQSRHWLFMERGEGLD
ncbi:sialidase-3 isoform X6 [Leopardus geoffroyi]|uniref:sialidase-3 isoform X6 n=1 Tax=Leopardus geoffroyi TaxID=46844 RepID=UPI001E266303|nr:sialidase-3 isoform X6 [Leopardus geoffroyi]